MDREIFFESKEAGSVNLRVKSEGRRIFFEFDAQTGEQAYAYNNAIGLVLEEKFKGSDIKSIPPRVFC